MELNGNDHPFPFMLQPSTNSGFNRSFGVQDLESHMEALTLYNPYHGFNTNHVHVHDDSTLHRMRIIGAANAATSPQVLQHYPNESFLRSPNYDQLVWSQTVSHHNLEPHRGRWLSMAVDPRGSRSLQKKIDCATPQEIHKIIKELSTHLHDLIKDDFGQFVVKKLFHAPNVSAAQTNSIMYLIVSDVPKLKDVCMHEKGNRVFQRLLENIETPYMMHMIADAVIFEVVVKNFVDIAKDKCGCSILQRCIGYAESEATEAFFKLINEIIKNAVPLSEHPYGNYVVQSLVKKGILGVNGILITQLRNTYFELSKSKYASNVVENLLQFSKTEDAAIIVQELMASPEFLHLLQHPFGNYVVKKALENTKV
ncbi:hypothetical protein Fmac_023307 [Flemingia macrophylla]|uniref:PUM-HD domain-containing protein n=1 Tax=Flemingia macrophylla TaxID=520843 RepID=A0ABD1LL61_9FABA